jgi:hypothetical protein
MARSYLRRDRASKRIERSRSAPARQTEPQRQALRGPVLPLDGIEHRHDPGVA